MIERKSPAEQFHALFENAPNGIIAFDAAGRIILVNAQAEKMFGYSREELIGQPAEKLIPMRFWKRHVDLRKKFVDAPQTRSMGTGRDLFGARKDGSEFAIEVGLNTATASTGDIVIATVVDITERVRAAEEKNTLEQGRKKVQLCEQLGIPACQHRWRESDQNSKQKQPHHCLRRTEYTFEKLLISNLARFGADMRRNFFGLAENTYT